MTKNFKVRQKCKKYKENNINKKLYYEKKISKIKTNLLFFLTKN